MNSPAELQGKVCLVTGANSGIGKATALGLAQMGATVVMSCRSLTPDGLETVIAVNYLAPFLLTHLLLDPLKAGATQRLWDLSEKLTQLAVAA